MYKKRDFGQTMNIVDKHNTSVSMFIYSPCIVEAKF